jgi:hypothetical protein
MQSKFLCVKSVILFVIVLTSRLLMAAILAGFAQESLVAQTWMPTGVRGTGAMSANGLVLAAAGTATEGTGIYISTNGGISWTFSEPLGNSNFSCVAVSPFGSAIVVIGTASQTLYVSTNLGIVWTPTVSNSQLDFATFSADGTLLLNTGELTTNLGSTWKQFQMDGDPLACNASASELICDHYPTSIDRSTNSGNSWSSSLIYSDYEVNSLTSSGDGRRLAAFWAGSGVSTSTNSGVTWAQPITNYRWYGASSIDGSRLAASPFEGFQSAGILFSTNFGQTWKTNVTPFFPFSGGPIVCSQDGTRWLASISTNLCIGYWPPSLAIQLSGTNLILSWPAPSTGLVLQQNGSSRFIMGRDSASRRRTGCECGSS